MTETQNQPREYDAVKGGESPVPLGAAVLGGIPGVKSRLASPAVEVRIAALSEALKHGKTGLDLIIGALQDDKSMAVKLAAYGLLRGINQLSLKQQFQNYLPTFDFDVIEFDSYKKNPAHNYAHFFPEDLGNGIVLEMVYIPGGIFMMGSPRTRKNHIRDEQRPYHQVKVPAFYAGKYAITQAQWQAVMGNNPSYFQGEKRPVENVSWDDAVEFCAKLSQTTERKYRLLSEAEWEYACRARTTTPFHFGETIASDLVNCQYKSLRYLVPLQYPSKETTDVGRFPPNAFGLYDMHGNVQEWCSDRWHRNYDSAPTNGSSWEAGTDNYRVLRGGSSNYEPFGCRSDFRTYGCSAERSLLQLSGFRVALVSP
jgi:formylglycine-generating enzyme required for sulfatase activity